MYIEQFSDLKSQVKFVIHARQNQAKISDNAVHGWDNTLIAYAKN